MIYFDHHASTPMLPEVWAAMQPLALEHFGNPASAHHAGRKARQALNEAREQLAALVDAYPDEVVFTSGATEANNLALFGLAGAAPGHILASPVEHSCVTEPLKALAARGFTVDMLPVNAHGVVEPTAYRERVQPTTRLAVVMLINHETGAIQPVAELAHCVNVPFHTDAAQALGKWPVSFRELGATTLSASAHKFGGPKGIGVLIVRRGTKLQPLLLGGHQQQGRRPGTEMPMLAVGMAKALEVTLHRQPAERERLRQQRAQLLACLHERCPPMVVNSPLDGSPYVLNVSFPGCRAELLLMRLDLAGLACSTGSACSSGSLLPSPVLQAMHVPDDVLRSAMRFSFGPSLTDADFARAAQIIVEAVRAVRA
jgi:cysteine desulfurase